MAICPECHATFDEDQKSCPADGADLLPGAILSTAGDLPIEKGVEVGEYIIEEMVGEGAFGRVYRAVHPLIGKAAAIKVLAKKYSDDPQIVSRFLSEARAVNRIRHRNIVDVFAFGVMDDGRQYLIMEMLEGQSLRDYVEEIERIDIEQALRILDEIGKALDAAHENGIVHRDLKPDNVFLCMDQDAVRPKLLDFGIAKLIGDEESHHQTKTGAAIGTPLYMSPEQCRGKKLDHRTDIYSFGVMAYQMLTGKLPFMGESYGDLLLKHATEPARPMSEVHSGLPKQLDGPVLLMLEKNPLDRPGSLREAMDNLIGAATQAGVGGVYRTLHVSRADVGGEAARTLSNNPPPNVTGPTINDGGRPAEAASAAQDTLPDIVVGSLPEVPKKRITPALALGAVAVVAGIVAFAVTRGDDPAASPVPPTPSATAAAATPTATASAIEAPAAPKKVVVTIRTDPADCDVYQGDERIGNTSTSIRLPAGDELVTLMVKKDGYEDKAVELTPAANVILNIELKKKPAKKRVHKDLSTPF